MSRPPACISTTSRCSLGSSTGWSSRATASLVIEHNLEVIKCADYVIDLGPEAGAAAADWSWHGHAGGSRAGRRSRTPDDFCASCSRPPRHAASLWHRVTRRWMTKSVCARCGDATAHFRPTHRRFHPRCARAQPEEHLARDSARQDGRRHRPERLGQIDRSRSISSLPKASGVFSTACRPTRGSSSSSSRSRTWISIPACRRAWRSSSASPAAAANRPSPRSRRSTISCGCSSRSSGRSIARSAMCRWRSRASRRSSRRRETAAQSAGRIRVLAPLVKARKGFHTDVARVGEAPGLRGAASSMAKMERVGQVPEARALPRAHHRCGRRRATRAAEREQSAASARSRSARAPRGCSMRRIAHTSISTEMSCPGCGNRSKNSIRVCSPSTRRMAGARSAAASARSGRLDQPRLEIRRSRSRWTRSASTSGSKKAKRSRVRRAMARA